MFRTFGLGLAVVLLSAVAALADPTCASGTWTNLTNGTAADAGPVMTNFNCLAPAMNPAFAGSIAVEGSGNTRGRFGASKPVYLIGDSPFVGLNLYYDGGWKYGKGSSASYGAAIGENAGTGSIEFYTTAATGNADAAASVSNRLTIASGGGVGIGANPSANVKLAVGGDPSYSGGYSDAILASPTWASGSLTGGGNIYDTYFALSGSSTVPIVTGYQANGGSLTGTPTLTNYISFYASAWPSGGTITNKYAFRASGAAAANTYGVYIDNAASYFGGSVGVGTSSPNTTLTVSSAGANGINLSNDTGATTNSERLFLSSSSGLYAIYNTGGTLSFASGGTIGSSSGTTRMTLSQAGNFILNTSQLVVTVTNGNVGIGTTTPGEKLEVNGRIKVGTLASASGTSLCIDGSNIIASCSSSARYKERVTTATFGLKEVLAMRPVTFSWKGRDERDLGFIAEEMASINTLFVTRKSGQIEGVKYPQMTAVLVNAVKELKAANDNQAAEISTLSKLNQRQAVEINSIRVRQAAELQELRSAIAELKHDAKMRTAQR